MMRQPQKRCLKREKKFTQIFVENFHVGKELIGGPPHKMITIRSALLLTKNRSSYIGLEFIRFKTTANFSSEDRKSTLTPISKIGVPGNGYIPQSFSNFPNPLTSPILFIKCLAKRVGLVGLNTMQIVDFRRNLKPNFLVWKNNAIEQYVLVNKAFAQKNLIAARPACSTYVYNALSKRLKSLPEDVDMDWKLLKFNAVPKIISFNNFPNEDGSTLCLQIVYKFNTKQRLVTLKNGEAKTQDKNLIEYLAFNVDPYTDDVCLTGSVFESEPTQALTDRTQSISPGEMMQNMVTYGDIYRSLPKKLQLENKK